MGNGPPAYHLVVLHLKDGEHSDPEGSHKTRGRYISSKNSSVPTCLRCLRTSSSVRSPAGRITSATSRCGASASCRASQSRARCPGAPGGLQQVGLRGAGILLIVGPLFDMHGAPGSTTWPGRDNTDTWPIQGADTAYTLFPAQSDPGVSAFTSIPYLSMNAVSCFFKVCCIPELFSDSAVAFLPLALLTVSFHCFSSRSLPS